MAVEMTEAGIVWPAAPKRANPLIGGFIYVKSSTNPGTRFESNGMEFLRGGSSLVDAGNTHPWLPASTITAPNGTRTNPFTGVAERLYMRIK